MADSRRRTDLIISLLLMAFAVWTWYEAYSFPRGTVVDPMGPAFWPQLLAEGIGLFSLALLVVALWPKKEAGPGIKPKETEASDEGVDEEVFSRFRFWGVIGVLAIYLVLLQSLGYFLGTPLMVLGVLLILGVRDLRPLLLSVLGLPLLWGIVFGYALGVPLPEGVFTLVVR